MKKILILIISIFFFFPIYSQKKKTNTYDLNSSQLSGLKFRSIGPAFMSGRIADIAINPENENEWYVAVGSGGVWKTTNSGTTWSPIADNQSFYSTGCITIDPHNTSRIWLGTGENVGGRHVGIGDGVYLSQNGGQTWKNMGLRKSEHISKIIVSPDDPNTVFVASQGPLWSPGGDRGLFKTTDGGKTWKNVLEINEWTGVTDLVIDHENSNILYAATWQKHRNVAAHMGGGPGTSLYKSVDNGETWFKINTGLPNSNLGKIGLAISPFDSSILYAAVETDRRKGGVYKTTNSGGSWKKMSDTVSGATGPHYYQELVASPHYFDKIYLMDVRVQVSDNGGKDFYRMTETEKHSDNHSLTFKESDPNYLLIGTDGGIYESFDNTKSWKYVSNLPLTQFYKVAVDDALPFYNVFGGTQDNNTQGGPSRTLKRSGIMNSDWFVLLGGDGHQPATEPGNPNVVYAQSQQGEIHRIDRTNGEATYIKPQNDIGDDYERFNWDSPILVSPHDPKTIFFASQRVWKSDNRGDDWTPISNDLTLNQERLSLPIMGKVQSWDNPWDVYAMSTYNTITSLSQSPANENIIYAGTDDGIIQYTRDGGLNWSRVNVEKLPGVPKGSFVNDIKADHFNEDVAYAVLDNHKFGDFKPYVYKTTDGGKSWSKISNGIPDNHIVWRLVQDHVDKNLLFLGTEYGVFVSINGGSNWVKFSNGIPTISIRDLAIQKRENDLVAATFGRGFYIMDDYSSLRFLSPQSLKSNLVFSPRKALQYTPQRSGSSSQGGNTFYAKNPDYGALLTFYISDDLQTKKQKRRKKEKALEKSGSDIPFPGWENLDEELKEDKPKVLIDIYNSENVFMDRLVVPYKKGFNRIAWNLTKRFNNHLSSGSLRGGYAPSVRVSPGKYSFNVFIDFNGDVSKIGSKYFNVERIMSGDLVNPNSNNVDEFLVDLENTFKELTLINHKFSKAKNNMNTINSMILKSSNYESYRTISKVIEDAIFDLDVYVSGNKSKKDVREKDFQTISARLQVASRGIGNSYGPTAMHMKSLKKAKLMLQNFTTELDKIEKNISKLRNQLESNLEVLILD